MGHASVLSNGSCVYRLRLFYRLKWTSLFVFAGVCMWFCWLVGWAVVWLFGWLVGYLVGWLLDCCCCCCCWWWWWWWWRWCCCWSRCGCRCRCCCCSCLLFESWTWFWLCGLFTFTSNAIHLESWIVDLDCDVCDAQIARTKTFTFQVKNKIPKRIS